MSSPSLVTTKELADHLRVTEKLIGKLRAEGLPFIRVSARKFRYDQAEVLAWIEQRTKVNGSTRETFDER